MTKNVKSVRNISVLVSVTLLGAACSGGGAATSESGTTLRIAVTNAPDTLDPQSSTSTSTVSYNMNVLEGLTQFQPDGTLKPLLAKSLKASSDGRTYTAELKEGVTFQDGTKFDSAAVKATFKRIADPAVRVPLRFMYAGITSVETPDAQTVVFHLSAPDPTFPLVLSAGAAMITSPKSLEADGNSYKSIKHPVGTGPYTFTEYKQDQEMTYARYDGYWGAKPHYTNLELKILPEAATRETAILSGSVDVALSPPVNDLQKLTANPDLNVILGDTTRNIFLSLNTQSQGKLSDPRVRQALNYAVDKEAIVKNVFKDAAKVSWGPASAQLQGYCDTGKYEYNPEKARKLLAEAGATNLQLKFIAPTGHYLQDIQAATAINGFFKDVGVTADVKTTDWATYTQWIAEVPPSAVGDRAEMIGWAGSFPDFTQFGGVILTDSIVPKGSNDSFYSNPKVDSLMKQATSELNPEKRDAQLCQAQKIMFADAPWLFLWTQKFPVITKKSVTGVETLVNETFKTLNAKPAN